MSRLRGKKLANKAKHSHQYGRRTCGKKTKLSSGEEQPRCHLLAFSLSDVSPFSLHLTMFFFFCFFSSSSSCGQEAGVAAAAEAGVAAAAEAEAGAEAEADAIAIVMVVLCCFSWFKDRGPSPVHSATPAPGRGPSPFHSARPAPRQACFHVASSSSFWRGCPR